MSSGARICGAGHEDAGTGHDARPALVMATGRAMGVCQRHGTSLVNGLERVRSVAGMRRRAKPRPPDSPQAPARRTTTTEHRGLPRVQSRGENDRATHRPQSSRPAPDHTGSAGSLSRGPRVPRKARLLCSTFSAFSTWPTAIMAPPKALFTTQRPPPANTRGASPGAPWWRIARQRGGASARRAWYATPCQSQGPPDSPQAPARRTTTTEHRGLPRVQKARAEHPYAPQAPLVKPDARSQRLSGISRRGRRAEDSPGTRRSASQDPQPATQSVAFRVGPCGNGSRNGG